MPPKFESSFIPKGPMPGAASAAPLASRKGEHTILGFLAMLIFVISVIAALAAFGYKFYLKYSIEGMTAELEAGRAALETETVSEITRLNNRLLAAETLVNRHLALTPLFKFLDTSTLRTVRFNDFIYSTSETGEKVVIKGEARSYASLALQADLLNKSQLFKNPVFSDLRLDDRGNVAFTFEAEVDKTLLSYKKELEKQGAARVSPTVATSTATTTPRQSSGQATTTATTTPPR